MISQQKCIGIVGTGQAMAEPANKEEKGAKVSISILEYVLEIDGASFFVGRLALEQSAKASSARGDASRYWSGHTLRLLVELNVDNGGWQSAGGAATCAFNLPATPGAHTIQTRATDIAGNVETPGQPLTVLVDDAPPQLALATPAAPSVPSRDTAGRWRVHLAGTASDPAPASGVISATVLLQGHDANAPSGGWQPASLQGADWTID